MSSFPTNSPTTSRWDKLPVWAVTITGLVWMVFAIFSSDATTGENLFRGYFIQDADEVVRAWQARCIGQNPNIIPYSNLSMPGWTLLLAMGEWIAQSVGAPLTLMGRVMTAAFGWACLHHLVQWTRNMGADWKLSLSAVLMIVACPAFFLLGFSVYPSVALASILVMALRYWSEERLFAAVAILSWAPMIRWEGILLVGLFGLAVLIRKRWKLIPVLLFPYSIFLGFNAYLYTNPLKPLLYRTNVWKVFHPELVWETVKPALINVSLFYSPLIWLLGILAALWLLFRARKQHWMLALAAIGLTTSLFSINHQHTVWVIRVFATPWMLCVMCIIVSAIRVSNDVLKRVVLIASLTAVLISAALSFSKIDGQTLPAEGGFRHEPGFHLYVRQADATPVVSWLGQQPADWVIINPLNANLMRADPTCKLQNNAIRMGTSNVSMDRSFKVTFGLPPGEGLLVFHTMPFAVNGCEEVKRFEKSNMVIHRCRNTTSVSAVQ